MRIMLPIIAFFAFIGFIFWLIKATHTVKTWKREDKKYRKENAKKDVKAEPVQTQAQINYAEIIAEKDQEIQDLKAKLREYGYFGDMKGVEFVNQQIPAAVPASTVVPHTVEKRTEKKHHKFRNICIGVLVFLIFNTILAIIF